MFVTQKQFSAHLDFLQKQLAQMNDKYWELRHAHARLLDELGYTEDTIPAHVELVRKKGRPEQGS
jgi:hypothetical protein